MRPKIKTAAVLLLVPVCAFFAGCKPIPPDNEKLTQMNFDNLGGTRYTEILLIYGNGLTKNVTAGVYNTVGMNGSAAENGFDSSPAAILDPIDMEKVKKNHKALKSIKNGPRRWTIDYLGVEVGVVRDFQGLDAHWVMWFPLPPEMLKGDNEPYTAMHANRDTSMGIRKGTRAYLLDDPDGNTWCMKSMSMVQVPDQKFEELKNLGSRLKLPDGWKFRSVVLKKDLVFTTDNGKTMITQDDIDNTYDRVGGPYSNYLP
jgi:hypothetical protein